MQNFNKIYRKKNSKFFIWKFAAFFSGHTVHCTTYVQYYAMSKRFGILFGWQETTNDCGQAWMAVVVGYVPITTSFHCSTFHVYYIVYCVSCLSCFLKEKKSLRLAVEKLVSFAHFASKEENYIASSLFDIGINGLLTAICIFLALLTRS